MTDAKPFPPTDPPGLSSVEARLQVSGNALVDCCNALGSEALSFLAERIREDFETQQQMLHCRSLPELAQVRARFLQRATDQYTAETGRMADIWARALDGMLHLKLG
ncbi:hypothetical protein C5F48_10940 [Cereibacter changlensis JA139]|uniref:Phasin domain-containing protein n=2 Tax=Cereibacter changlensis TaxID=402884 RepID=A0A2T4JV11_9RHOB|nr:phasin family protein [Cereibacter changlensis]PTE21716.1 hypothetical protein C5F48_10940 [Cereibacter changlensis JA139]PZX57215.1 phasin protein [Cereibacter changlensis]